MQLIHPFAELLQLPLPGLEQVFQLRPAVLGELLLLLFKQPVGQVLKLLLQLRPRLIQQFELLLILLRLLLKAGVQGGILLPSMVQLFSYLQQSRPRLGQLSVQRLQLPQPTRLILQLLLQVRNGPLRLG